MDPPYGGPGGPVAGKKTEAQLKGRPKTDLDPKTKSSWSLGVDVQLYFVPP